MQSAHFENSVSSGEASSQTDTIADAIRFLVSHGVFKQGEFWVPERPICPNIINDLLYLNKCARLYQGHEEDLDIILSELRRDIAAAPEQETYTVGLIVLILAHTRDCRGGEWDVVPSLHLGSSSVGYGNSSLTEGIYLRRCSHASTSCLGLSKT